MSVSRSLKILAASVVSAGLLAAGVMGWLRFSPVTVADGWRYDALPATLDRITALARMPDGGVIATLSAKQHGGEKGRGQLIRLDATNGQSTVLADGLYKPAGLLPYDGGIIITQEFSDQPVMFWKAGSLQPHTMLVKPESITQTPSGQWLVIEDAENGRLLQIDPQTRKKTVLFQGFVAGEGVCVGRDQRIFVVDSKAADLMEYRGGKMETVLGGLNGPGFLRCTQDGLWITEDVTNNGRLMFYDYQQLHVVARHLHSPQGVLEEGSNAVLVAEQGRSRLLRFTRQ